MALLDAVTSTETNSLPEELIIKPPTLDVLESIAKTAQLDSLQLASSLQNLTTQLNNETATELGVATIQDLLPTFSSSELEELTLRRVQNDQIALKNLVQILSFFSQDQSSSSSETFPPSLDTHDFQTNLTRHNYLHPRAPTSTFLQRLHWYVAGLTNQWRYCDKPGSDLEAEQLLFYQNYAKELFQTNKRETASKYTDQTKLAIIMGYTLEKLVTNHEIDINKPILVVGCGSAELEGQFLSPYGLPPSQIDGIDILTKRQIGDVWDGLTFHGGVDLKNWNPENRLYGTIISVGSVLNNNPNPHAHLEYFMSFSRLLAPGGMLIYETRAIEPDLNNNTASARSEAFLQNHPHRFPGASTSVHSPPGFEASPPSIQLQPHQLISVMTELSGLRRLNYPFNSPAFEDRFFEQLASNQFVLENLKTLEPSAHDALANPVWYAGPGNWRRIDIAQKVAMPTPLAIAVNQVFARALEHPLSTLSSPRPSLAGEAIASP